MSPQFASTQWSVVLDAKNAAPTVLGRRSRSCAQPIGGRSTHSSAAPGTWWKTRGISPDFSRASSRSSLPPRESFARQGPGIPPRCAQKLLDNEPLRGSPEGMPLLRVISRAYAFPEYRIIGPDWLASERYAIAAEPLRPPRSPLAHRSAGVTRGTPITENPLAKSPRPFHNRNDL